MSITTRELLADLHEAGIRLEAHGDKLRFTPRSAMTPDLLAKVKEYKSDLLQLLTLPPLACDAMEAFPDAVIESVEDEPLETFDRSTNTQYAT